MKVAVVIPAHNEELTIAEVIRQIPKTIKGVKELGVFVVDDASTDQTKNVATLAGATALRHRINLGAGGATLTGMIAAIRSGFDTVVTLDADGQHDPRDIHTLLAAHRTHGADLVIGSRFLSQTISDMPLLKNFGNRVMNGITYLFSGRAVTDSQSGFRLFGPKFLTLLDRFSTGGYEFCSETVIVAKKAGLAIVEAPIRTIYLDDRRGQNPLNGVHILLRLFYRSLTG